MKKLSHRNLVLFSSLIYLAFPMGFWTCIWLGYEHSLIHVLLLVGALVSSGFERKAQKQIDECAEQMMREAGAMCFHAAFYSMLLLSAAYITKAPWATIQNVGPILFTVAACLMALRGVVFCWLDKRGSDEC